MTRRFLCHDFICIPDTQGVCSWADRGLIKTKEQVEYVDTSNKRTKLPGEVREESICFVVYYNDPMCPPS